MSAVSKEEQLLPRRMSIDEYIEFENASEFKHEYVDGYAVAMAGSLPEHSLVTVNFAGELRNLLKGTPCRVYDSNLRIGIKRTFRFRYSDAVVVCGPIEVDPSDKSKMSILNPRVIIEVSSPSTEGVDKDDKVEDYTSIPTLEHYVLVSSRRESVQVISRRSDGTWSLTHSVGREASVTLETLGVTIPLAEIYRDVTFAPIAPPSPPEKGEGSGETKPS
jgi:Uma2 family endonuclease